MKAILQRRYGPPDEVLTFGEAPEPVITAAVGVDHTEKLDMLRAVGADEVRDYTGEPALVAEDSFDLIVDVASNLPFEAAGRALTEKGRFILVGHDHFGASAGRFFGSIGRFLRMRFSKHLRGHLVDPEPGQDTSHRIGLLQELMEAGKIVPSVDRAFPLGEVCEALRHLQHGQPLGKIVVRVREAVSIEEAA